MDHKFASFGKTGAMRTSLSRCPVVEPARIYAFLRAVLVQGPAGLPTDEACELCGCPLLTVLGRFV